MWSMCVCVNRTFRTLACSCGVWNRPRLPASIATVSLSRYDVRYWRCRRLSCATVDGSRDTFTMHFSWNLLDTYSKHIMQGGQPGREHSWRADRPLSRLRPHEFEIPAEKHRFPVQGDRRQHATIRDSGARLSRHPLGLHA